MAQFQPMSVAEIIESVTTPPLPFRVTAFDGSATGPADAPLHLEVVSPKALSYLISSPGDLGLARAYITSELLVHGENEGHPYGIFTNLQDLYAHFRRPSAATLLRITRSLKSLDAFHLVQPPAQEEEPGWQKWLREGLTRHSKERDKESISHHYDVSNDFYELFLGNTMTYTCAYYPEDQAIERGPGGGWDRSQFPKGTAVLEGLDEAQTNKYRLVFDKLNLKEGERLLDVGCGWGGMVRYAASQGVKALGVTLSKEQAAWAQERIKKEGLEELAEVRCMDYRDVTERDFDAISAIGVLEHIGRDNYNEFFTRLHAKLRPGGRMLNHCITRPTNKRINAGKFIDRYIFPDGELTGSGTIITAMQDAGLEVQHEENLRVHYQRTLHDWCELLAENWDEAVRLVGIETARLYGMYMAGSEWGFEHNIVQLHQVLAVKLTETGATGQSVRQWWRP